MIKRIIYTQFTPDFTIEDLHRNNMLRSMISNFPEEFIQSESKLVNARNKAIGLELVKYPKNEINPDLNTLMYGKSTMLDRVVMTMEV